MSYYHTGLKLGSCGKRKIKIQSRVGKLNKTVIVDTYVHIYLPHKSECSDEKQKMKEMKNGSVTAQEKVYLGNRDYEKQAY